MPKTLPAFDEAEIPPVSTIVAAAHSSQPAIPKTTHGTRMHCHAIPSILDESSDAIAGHAKTARRNASLNSPASPRPATHSTSGSSRLKTLKEEVEIILVSPKVLQQ